MIGFAIPWIAGAAVAAAVGITLLHFLSVRQPRVLSLPTTRFMPEWDARAVARQAKPNDLLLLFLRVAALLSVGAALAGLRCGAGGARVTHLIVADASLRSDSAAVLTRATAAGRATDATRAETPTVLWIRGLTNDPGAAIAAAIRASAAAATKNPALIQLSLSVVMPSRVRSHEGWDAWRLQWPAAIRVIPERIGDSLVANQLRTMQVVGATNGEYDVVASAVAQREWSSENGGSADVMVQRNGNESGAVDAATDAATIVVRWPQGGVPTGWLPTSAPDSAGAVAAAGIALVAPFARRATPPTLSDSIVALAWWADGVPAVVERLLGTSCVREVGIVIADASDLLLSPSANGLLEVLKSPCGGVRMAAPIALAVSDSAMLTDANRFRAMRLDNQHTQPEWLASALLAVAALLLSVEWMLRRRSVEEVTL